MTSNAKQPKKILVVDVGGTQTRTEQMLAAEDVQRQITVMAVIAVEKAAFLFPVERIVGGIQVQYDLLRGLAVRFEKHIHQKPVDYDYVRA